MNKVMNLLGLAQRAGKVVSGDFIVEKALKSKSVKLLLLATDAGPIRRRSTNTVLPMCISSVSQ